jgi:hexosaminidase
MSGMLLEKMKKQIVLADAGFFALKVYQKGAWMVFVLCLACSQHAGSGSAPDVHNQAAGLLPIVKNFSFSGKNFAFRGDWKIEGAGGEQVQNSLREGLKSYLSSDQIALSQQADATIRFILKPGSIAVESLVDTNKAAIAEQAYSLVIRDGSIVISANAAQGLYYGVQTFLQLVQAGGRERVLPEGEITDWPDLSLRMIYWDDAHHLEKLDALKRIILQASQYKINAFAIKLEGHFQFKSAMPIVEPYALSAEQYRELSDYARAHFVELVPYLDAPAHVSFILKHPEYAGLRLYPNNNYELNVADTSTISLVKNMFDDLLEASPGGKYIMLSTDEAYYTGKAPKEKQAALAAGSNGKLLAGFVKIIADELNKKHRTVIFWGEYPLTPGDIKGLPSYLLNGEYNDMSPVFGQHGIRQLIYTSTQGAEPVFPNYYSIYSKDTLMPDGNDRSPGRVAGMMKDIHTAINEKKISVMGIIVAGWGDAGLHPETFWLGYATGTAMGWNLGKMRPDDLMHRFYLSFYGDTASDMEKIYRLLSTQAGFFEQSWDWQKADLRKPILGNSEGIFPKPEKARDQFLPMLPIPSADNLSVSGNWDSLNRNRMALLNNYRSENDELMRLLNGKISMGKQQYNLEVLHSIAALCKQNLDMLRDLQRANTLLDQGAAKSTAEPGLAVSCIDSALSIVREIKRSRDSTLGAINKVWFKEWWPLVREANGRRFLHEVDDIKDHQPGRTVDLSYLIYRQLYYPLGTWVEQVRNNRNIFARRHGLPAATMKIEWNLYE